MSVIMNALSGIAIVLGAVMIFADEFLLNLIAIILVFIGFGYIFYSLFPIFSRTIPLDSKFYWKRWPLLRHFFPLIWRFPYSHLAISLSGREIWVSGLQGFAFNNTARSLEEISMHVQSNITARSLPCWIRPGTEVTTPLVQTENIVISPFSYFLVVSAVNENSVEQWGAPEGRPTSDEFLQEWRDFTFYFSSRLVRYTRRFPEGVNRRVISKVARDHAARLDHRFRP